MSAFENAVIAVIDGDTAALRRLLSDQPDLIRARSERDHHATLLHYIAANGVEDEHQRTPPNALEIARLLLDAGAEPDALATMYGGNSTTLCMLVSSVHPAQAGVQADLVRLLCDYGANPNGLPLATAITFRYMPAANALVEKGARVDNPVFAAALGRFAELQSLLANELTPYHDPFGRVITDHDKILKTAFVAACIADKRHIVIYLLEEHGVPVNARAMAEQTSGMHEAARQNFTELAKRLLDYGASVELRDRDGMTPLHWAAWYGHLDIMELLLRHGAPLEAINKYGGTVLDGAVWGFRNTQHPPANAIQVIERLLAAGANAGAVSPYPTGSAAFDAAIRPYRTAAG